MYIEYEIVDHGVDNPQYFQGCGTFGTDYEQCVTGIGDSFNDALNDAIDSAAQSTGNGAGMWGAVAGEAAKPKEANDRLVAEGEDIYYHVSIRFNVVNAKVQP